MVKIFHKCIKAFLAMKVKKSVPKLTFAKLAFSKSNFLDLVNFGFLNLVKSDFLDLAKFAMVDRFLILPPTSLPSVSAILLYIT